MKRKILILDEQTEKVFQSVCDAALRHAGNQARPYVNHLDSKVVSEEDPCCLESSGCGGIE